MGADAVHVLFGVRVVVDFAAEVACLEERADPRLEAARRAGLKVCFGRPTAGDPYFLLIGSYIGTFGVENSITASVSEGELQLIMDETKGRLTKAGLDHEEPMLHLQLEAQH